MSFEDRARRLLDRLDVTNTRRTVMPRPFFAEVTGSPSSGKTTIIDILDPFFRRQGYRVLTPQEGAEVIRHISRDTPLYNIRTGTYALNNVIDYSVSASYDLVLFDRSLLDAWCWMDFWHRKGKLTSRERKHYQAFFTQPRWRSMLDVTFFVVCTAEEAIRREKAVALTRRWGETTNPETIRMLVDVFNNGYTTWQDRAAPVAHIDTTGLNRKKMSRMVLEKTLDLLEQRFPEEK